jgi:N-acyl-D-aspartate/D-glutamate deacylase
MRQFDTVIRNGTIVDGSGRVPAYRADLAVKDGRIAEISGRIHGRGDRELDATDCIVAPGAVETHGHYDHQLFWDPYCSPVSSHGVTTVTIGTCGFGWAPCRPQDHDAYARFLSRVLSIPPTSLSKWLPWDWETLPDFLDSVGRVKLGVNVASMVPLSPLRAYVMGIEEACSRTEMTESEIAQMTLLFRQAMDAGAWGFSGHRNPEDRTESGGLLPTQVASRAEMLRLAKVLGEYAIGSVYWTAGIEDERDFLRDLCRVSGRPLQWVGVIQSKDEAHDVWRQDLAWSEENVSLGLPMYAQTLAPVDVQFRLAEFNLFDSIPSWAAPLLGSPRERLAKLQAPGARDSMKRDLHDGKGFFHGDWNRVYVAKAVQEHNRKYEGKSIAEVARSTGTADPLDAFFDLAIDEELYTEFHAPAMSGSDEDASAVLLRANSTIPSFSDGGAHYRFLTCAHWPTYVLSKFVRERREVSLELAHYKMSALPAWIMGYRDRGVLREDLAADVMVYDLNRLSYSEAFTKTDTPAGDPRRFRTAEGYRYILVNGEVTFEEGIATGVRSGQLLRSTRYAGR